MKNIILKITGMTLALMLVFGINSCVKDDFDQPPVLDIPVGELKTIAEIQEIASIHDDTDPLKITEDMTIAGLITMGEHSGNLYKQAILEDATGGVMLRFTGSTTLNVGDSIRVNMKGGKIYNYNGLPQVDSLDITDNVMKLSAGNDVVLPELTLTELNENPLDYVGLVVKIVDVQFVESELGKIFAAEGTSENRSIEGCSGGSTIIRTSGYSNFASKTLPEGSGSMIAFVSYFNGTQLIVRSYEEMEMDNERCEIEAPDTNSSIKDVLELYQGERLQITDSLVFEATIVANDETGNIFKAIVVQDDEMGLFININEYDLFQSYDYNVGQKVVVSVKGLYLDKKGEVVQLGSVYLDGGEEKFGGIGEGLAPNYITPVNGGEVLAPIVKTIPELTDDYIGMLVELQNVQFVDSELSETYADAENLYGENRTLTDCDGNQRIVRTSGYADFAGEQVAQGNGTFVAIYSSYNGTKQFLIRDLTDVQLNGARCDVGGGGGTIDPVAELNEDFGSLVDYDDIGSLEGWTNISVEGSRTWIAKVYNDDPYAQASGYNSGDDVLETWIITPPVMNIQNKKLSFKSAIAYWEHTSGHPGSVWISEDFVGDNFETATWTELNVTIAQEADGDNIWVESGEFDLSAYSGNAAIAFKYEGSNTESTTFRVDNVVVSDGNGGGGGGSVDPVDEVDEDFQSMSQYDEITFEGWTSLTVEGDRAWIAQTFQDEVYMQGSGYNSGLDVMETWFITPPVTNIEDKTLSFKSAIAYWAHGSGHPGAVLVSEDFDGENFETANWTEIYPTIAQESDGDHTWVESGEYDLSAFSGNAAIAFRYVGSETESTTFRVDNVKITDGTGGGGGGGGGGGSTVESVNEDFSGSTNYEDIELEGWVNVMVDGDRRWQGKEYNSDMYAQATGYNSGLSNMECWLITPVVSNIGSKTLSLRTAQAYWAHGSGQPLTILISTDYDGEDYENATWEAIDVTIASEASGDHNWVESGSVDLSNFDGDAAIAFKYVGSETQSTSIRLDDIVIE